MLMLNTPAESPTASIAQARFLLSPPAQAGGSIGVLVAAGACAASALALAAVVVLGGPVRTQITPEVGANPLPPTSGSEVQQPLLSH